MIKEPNMSVEQPHSLGAVLKGAILLIFFVFGVTTYAQSYNAPISYRVSGTTQSTTFPLLRRLCALYSSSSPSSVFLFPNKNVLSLELTLIVVLIDVNCRYKLLPFGQSLYPLALAHITAAQQPLLRQSRLYLRSALLSPRDNHRHCCKQQ